MRTRLMTTLVMAVSLLVSGQAFAQLPTFQSGQVLTADQLNAIVRQVNRNANAAGGNGGGATHTVDCSSGTIADAMSQAQPGDTIMITGTCNEAVVVDKDGITLDGGGSAVIDGSGIDAAVISVNGHQNVTIKGLTVQNGLSGIRLVESAAAWLVDVTAQGSRSKSGYESGSGIAVATSSFLGLTGTIVVKDNAQSGLWAGQSSSVVVFGNFVIQGNKLPTASLQVTGNGSVGIDVVGAGLFAHSASGDYTTIHATNNTYAGVRGSEGATILLWSGTNIEATGNGGAGLEVGNSSSAAFYGWGAVSRRVTGVFNSNGWSGIAVWGNSSLNVWDDGVAVNITSTNNSGSGLGISDGSAASLNSPASEPSSKLVFSNNGWDGISVDNTATLYSKLPSEIKNNAYEGVDAWGSSNVGLEAATVTDNTGYGIEANTNSSIWLTTSRVANNNGGDGIQVGNNSTVHIYDTDVTGNAGNGIGVYNHSFVQSYRGVGPSITGNGGHGLNIWNGSSVQLDNATVTGNSKADVTASFGSRFIFEGNSTLGTIYCDDSVLSAGDAVCPE